MSEPVKDTINRSLSEQFELQWQEGDRPAIASYLPASNQSDDYLATLEELVRIDLEYAWRDASQSERRTTEDYLETFPELNDPARLRRILRQEFDVRRLYGDQPAGSTFVERFPAILKNDAHFHSQETVVVSSSATMVETGGSGGKLPTLGEFGDYELIGKIGAGGMGVVYKAHQKKANRTVAVKVIHVEKPGSRSDDKVLKAVKRFRTEAQAAAKLHHPNIVPVYDVGQVDEHLYFSMQLVRGASLSEMVSERPLESRTAASCILGVAKGMQEAHRNGILHRDLKPHNVLVDAQSNQPMIADFGLAKVIESDDELTKTGEVIGTPSYMPPEQISSIADTKEPGDIYSIGATLYHLLTGRPPFQAPNTLATMRQVLFEEVVSPRQLNPEIDVDLETICLKCLQKETTQRYDSATALAADLQRYLDGEPILARPISRWERAQRWRRRNPLAAGLSLLAMGLAVAVFVAVVVGYQQTSVALAASERNFGLARNTVDELYVEVSDIDLKDAPGLQPLKEKLLARSLRYYQSILEERGGDDVSQELALIHFRVGAIQEQLGTLDEAKTAYQNAATIQAELLRERKSDANLLMDHSNSLNGLAQVLQQQGETAEAITTWEQAEAIREGLVEESPDDGEAIRKLANVEMNLGLAESRQANWKTARERMQMAQDRRERALSQQATTELKQDLAKGFFNLGGVEVQTGEFDDAVGYLTQSINQFDALLEQRPESLSTQQQIAMAYSLRADANMLRGDTSQAVGDYKLAKEHFDQLVEENPKVASFRSELLVCLLGQSQLRLTLGQDLAAAALATDPPNESQLAQSQSHIEEADRLLRSAVEQGRVLRNIDPDSPKYALDLSVALAYLAEVELMFGQTDSARALFQEALEVLGNDSTSDSDPMNEHRILVEESLRNL